MKPTLETILNELMLLVYESEQYHQESENEAQQAFSQTLADVRQMLAEMRRRTLAASKRYVVAIVGLSNVGKSTLLNALFGQDLAPRRNGPCTAAPIEFVYGDQYQVSVHYFTSIRRPVWPCADTESVHERLKALADSSGAEQSRTIKRVIVHAPLPLLKNGLVIADTPGFGAAQLDGAEGSHEESLKAYLRDAVSQVFWTVNQGSIGKTEIDFHDSFFGHFCDDVIVNVRTEGEEYTQKNKEDFIKRFSKHFQHRLPTFHFVEAKLGLKARKKDDDEALEAAGIPAIETRVQSLAEIEGRVKGIENALLELAKELRDKYADYCSEYDVRRTVFWRPDSFDRWSAACGGNVLHDALTEILTF